MQKLEDDFYEKLRLLFHHLQRQLKVLARQRMKCFFFFFSLVIFSNCSYLNLSDLQNLLLVILRN